MLIYICAASRGSTRIECSFGPSGVPSWSPPHHALRCGWALNPATPFQLAPPSSERNRPCGDVPANQTPGCDACPGVSQNAWSTTRPLPASKAGGVTASFQVLPLSVERNTVGPRCPVRAAASSVLPSRGSSIAWWTMCPRNCGPGELPGAAGAVRLQRPQALAGRNQQACPLRGFRAFHCGVLRCGARHGLSSRPDSRIWEGTASRLSGQGAGLKFLSLPAMLPGPAFPSAATTRKEFP